MSRAPMHAVIGGKKVPVLAVERKGGKVRYRLARPSDFDARSFRTVKMGGRSQMVMGCQVGQYDAAGGYCRGPMQAQAFIRPAGKKSGNPRAPRAPWYDPRRGWRGGASDRLYAFVDKRTGEVRVAPGGGTLGTSLVISHAGGPEVDVRPATRAEGEAYWQSPLHSGWKVENPPISERKARAIEYEAHRLAQTGKKMPAALTAAARKVLGRSVPRALPAEGSLGYIQRAAGGAIVWGADNPLSVAEVNRLGDLERLLAQAYDLLMYRRIEEAGPILGRALHELDRFIGAREGGAIAAEGLRGGTLRRRHNPGTRINWPPIEGARHHVEDAQRQIAAGDAAGAAESLRGAAIYLRQFTVTPHDPRRNPGRR